MERYSPLSASFKDFDDKGLSHQDFLRIVQILTKGRFKYLADVSDLLTFEYTNWTNKDDPIANRDEYIQFFSDLSMVAPSVQLADYIAAAAVPIWFYIFDHRYRITLQKGYHRAGNKAYHQFELHYLFGAPFSQRRVSADPFLELNFNNTDDIDVSKVVMRLWSNFAKHGAPTPDDPAVDSLSVSWTQFKKNTSDILKIGSQQYAMQQHFNAHRMQFWNNVVYNRVKAGARYGPALSRPGRFRQETIAMWTLFAFCILLIVVVVILAVILHRTRRYLHYVYRAPSNNIQS